MRAIQVENAETGEHMVLPREGYAIDSHGSIKRLQPKLSKAEKRALRLKKRQIQAENAEKAPLAP